MQKKVLVLALCLVCFSCVGMEAGVYAVDFYVSKPTETQKASHSMVMEGEASSRNHDSAISRIFKIMTHLGGERNYYELAAVVDTNKIVLDSGDIVHLIGLVSGDEVVERKRAYASSQVIVRHPVEIVKDFMEAYLSDKKMKVRFSEAHGFDESGHPYAYVTVVDDGLFNEVLVRYGYGMVASNYYFPESYAFAVLQSEAQIDESGIWRRLY